jgi:ParB-like nuclease domain
MNAPYQLLPPLSPVDEAALRAHIEKHGVLVPVLVDENGSIIDGHHRAKLAAELGKECPREVIEGLSEDEKRLLAVKLNALRRNLTREQIDAAVALALRIAPERSDRQVAADLKLSPTTVGKTRAKLEQSGDVSTRGHVIDTQGRKQPATKPAASKPAKRKLPPPIVERVVPPPELRDPLKEFDAVVERELVRLDGVRMGRPAAAALRRVCVRLRAAFADLLRAAKGDA